MWQRVVGIVGGVTTNLNAEEPAMTATPILTSRPLHDSSDSLLRFAIRVDATACAGLGLLVAVAADPLSRLSGLSAASEWIAGAVLVVYGVGLYVAAAVPNVRRVGVGIVVANVVFALVAMVVLATGALPLTTAGVASSIGAVAATLALAGVQYLGVRRLA